MSGAIVLGLFFVLPVVLASIWERLVSKRDRDV